MTDLPWPLNAIQGFVDSVTTFIDETVPDIVEFLAVDPVSLITDTLDSVSRLFGEVASIPSLVFDTIIQSLGSQFWTVYGALYEITEREREFVNEITKPLAPPLRDFIRFALFLPSLALKPIGSALEMLSDTLPDTIEGLFAGAVDEIIKGAKEEEVLAHANLRYTIKNDEVHLEEVEIEYKGEREKFPVERVEVPEYVPFILWRLRGTRGVCLIEDEYGRRRYLPRIIVRAMEEAKRRIKVIACAPALEDLIRVYGVRP